MKKIGRLVAPAIADGEILRHGKATRILEDWAAVVGEGLAKRSWPDRFTKGTVWVAVTGSAWAQELRLQKETILARLNQEAGEVLFTNVRFGVRPLPVVGDATMPVESPDTALLPDTALSIREIAERRLARRQKARSNADEAEIAEG